MMMPVNFKNKAKNLMRKLMLRSLNDAARQQGMDIIIRRLEKAVPDISGQYSTFKVDDAYMNTKIRNMHAFQMSLVESAIGDFKSATIADIGDSSGTHMQYIKELYSSGRDLKCLSVNSDKLAVEKIRAKGLDALYARAEDLSQHGVNADIFLCFEVLEHLSDPCAFLYALAHKTTASFLLVTVPYLKTSRVGLHHIRGGLKGPVRAENTHIFELSPQDWKLIARHSGWAVAEEKIYRQYPGTGLMRAMSPVWRRYDFEGFYGMVLKRDFSWSEKYKDWRALDE